MVKRTRQYTRDDWRKPTEEMRTSKGRRFTLPPDVHELLDDLPDRTASAYTAAAILLLSQLVPPNEWPAPVKQTKKKTRDP